jgi:ribonuclease Z
MFEVIILGTGSAIPAFGRHLSGQIVVYHHRLYLIDCGEGTQFQLNRYRVPIKRLDAIFISHLHGDHVLGLPGLLSSMSLGGRTKLLPIIGPEGIKELVETQLRLTHGFLTYPLEFREISRTDESQIVFQTSALRVKTIPLHHRIPCIGFRFDETLQKRKFLVQHAYALNIPKEYFHLIKQGVAFTLPDGRKIEPEDCLGEPNELNSYAYCSDTRFAPEIVPFIEKVSLLYHEATFLQSQIIQAEATAHSTAFEAGKIASMAGVDAMLIGHFSARYKEPSDLLDEARTVFPNTYLAIEGKTYPVPYEESDLS